MKDGLYVIDERHAQYLLDWEGQDNGLGGVIKYDDNWIEVNDTLPDDVQEAYQNHVKKKEYELAQEDLLYALKLLKKEDEYKKLRNGNW